LVGNPVIRTGDDLERQLRNLRKNLDAADPYWTFDVTIAQDMTSRTLRAKDPVSGGDHCVNPGHRHHDVVE
jgi:hypothetical protein